VNQIKFIQIKLFSYTVSIGCGKPTFVLTAHYDVSITPRPAKNI